MEVSQEKSTKAFDNMGFETSTEKMEPCKTEKTVDVEASNGGASEREQWDNPIEFLLSCVAMSVGLGNVWRFPFTAYANGGGAFLIPYLIVLFFIGRPIYYLELLMGQFSSSGPVKIWSILPLFRGVGYAQVLAAWCLVTYYTSLMGLAIFYMFASFNSELPWATCSPDAVNCFDANTNLSTVNINTTVSSSEWYFVNEVLAKHPNGLDDGIFAPEWRLSVCLLTAWLVIFFVLVKGIKSSGKVAYFTALFPYVVLFILLGRGITLPGSMKGIKYFLTPQWEKLLDVNVWYEAVGQCFFSLSAGFGCIPMFSSFNKFRHNINRDVNIISLIDTLTSLLAGITIFAILGHLAELMGVDDISLVVKNGGTSLAFISYPDVIARFTHAPQFFSVLFFLMLLTLGIGSASALAGGVITTICDQFPKARRSIVTMVVCCVGFLLGLFYCTPQGDYILSLVDFYAGTFVVYIFSFMMCIGVHWVYGFGRFSRDIEFMLQTKTHAYWKVCWVFIVPVVLGVIFIYKLATWKALTYGSYVYGPIANGFGGSLVALAVIAMPVCIISTVLKRKEGTSWLEALRGTLQPTDKWCPKNPLYRKEYEELLSSSLGPRPYVLEEVAGAKINPTDPSLSVYNSL